MSQYQLSEFAGRLSELGICGDLFTLAILERSKELGVEAVPNQILGMRKAAVKKKLFANRREKILALRKEGKSLAEIGKEVGISRQAVHGHLLRAKCAGVDVSPPSSDLQARLSKVEGAVDIIRGILYHLINGQPLHAQGNLRRLEGLLIDLRGDKN
ncbi:MAG TPA: hypothetical protein EYP59_15500 [Thiotrichaceae bacterium]|nr:hypothetical protein [Thiotrichaceae bacterium]